MYVTIHHPVDGKKLYATNFDQFNVQRLEGDDLFSRLWRVGAIDLDNLGDAASRGDISFFDYVDVLARIHYSVSAIQDVFWTYTINTGHSIYIDNPLWDDTAEDIIPITNDEI